MYFLTQVFVFSANLSKLSSAVRWIRVFVESTRYFVDDIHSHSVKSAREQGCCSEENCDSQSRLRLSKKQNLTVFNEIKSDIQRWFVGNFVIHVFYKSQLRMALVDVILWYPSMYVNSLSYVRNHEEFSTSLPSS